MHGICHQLVILADRAPLLRIRLHCIRDVEDMAFAYRKHRTIGGQRKGPTGVPFQKHAQSVNLRRERTEHVCLVGISCAVAVHPQACGACARWFLRSISTTWKIVAEEESSVLT